jgi:rhodanese-related sulfurtransferase
MNRSRVICILLFILLSIPSVVLARDIAPFVSTDWLEKNLSLPGLVVIDARTAVEYQKSHIPNSINSWNGQWAVTQNGLLRKLPADRDGPFSHPVLKTFPYSMEDSFSGSKRSAQLPANRQNRSQEVIRRKSIDPRSSLKNMCRAVLERYLLSIPGVLSFSSA